MKARLNFHRYMSWLTYCLLTVLSTSAHSSFAQKKKLTGYGAASYSVAESQKYMRNWLLSGPHIIDSMRQDQQTQMSIFKKDSDLKVTVVPGKITSPILVDKKGFPWTELKSQEDIINLDKHYGQIDFAAVYALAEIKADQEQKTFLAAGSDDGIRIWHNGKLIHDNWIPRGVTKDDDLVPIHLVKGSNQILIKVQDLQGEWGFAIRTLSRETLSEKLIDVAGKGDIDQVNLLLNAGADLNYMNTYGMAPVSNARLQGRDEVVSLLLSKGAKDVPMPDVAKLVSSVYGFLEGKANAGIAVLVAKDGNVVYKKGFGFADIANKKPVTPVTKFRIGSITKQFTAAAILKLQEEGKISVKDKLSKFIPDFPRGDEVTIHHLLTHTSGIHSYTGKDEFLKKVTSPVTEDELISFFRNDPYDFNPGDAWVYNNSAYFLLGHIIGKVSGKPYSEYLKATFFDPLDMKNTGIYTNENRPENEALGYTKENDKYTPAMDWNMSWAGGAGAMYSTAEDLHKWNEALFNGKVLQEKSLTAAFTPVALNNGSPASSKYGYGWGISDYRGVDFLAHSGGLHGFACQLARYPKENLTVVLLTNLMPPEANLNPSTIAEFFLWEKMEKQKSRSMNAMVKEDVTVYLGRYDFKGAGVMTITAEGDNLFAQLGPQPKFPIFPAGEGEYFWKVVDARIKFIKKSDGTVEEAEFQQNGNKLVITKLKDEVIVSVDKALYKLYSGKYDLGNNYIITVSTDQEKIFAQGQDQPKYEIHPLSETEFIVMELNARLIFMKEPDGKVSKMVLDMGGQKRDVVRVE